MLNILSFFLPDAEDFDVDGGANLKRRTGKQSKVDDDGKDHMTAKGLDGSMVLATITDITRGQWKTAQVMYSYHGTHRVRN